MGSRVPAGPAASTKPGTGGRRLPRTAACLGGVVALAVTLSAGCGSGARAPAPAPNTSQPRAILLAARQAQHVTSFAATISERLSGARAGTVTGSIRVQAKPALILDEAFTFSGAGHPRPGRVHVIVTGHALYLQAPPLTRRFGKPWIKVASRPPLNSPGITFGQAGSFGQPLSGPGQSPLTAAAVLAAARHLRPAGTELVGGVATTHYTGTFSLASMLASSLAKLPAAERQLARQLLQAARLGPGRLDVWIDHRHQLRQITVQAAIGPEQVTITLRVTQINKPVHVAVPPASQVATVSPGMLGAAGG